MKKCLWMSSAAVVIGALRVEQRIRLFENELKIWENHSFPLYEFQVTSHL